VRILPISAENNSPAVLPSEETFVDRTYPITGSVTFYVRPGAPPLAEEFCRYMAGPDTVRLIHGMGMWPEFELAQGRARLRLAAVKAGKGPKVTVSGLSESERLVAGLGLKFTADREAAQMIFHAMPLMAEAAQECLDGNADLLVFRGASPERLVEAAGKLVGKPKHYLLGHVGLGIVVNPQTAVSSLSLDELRQIGSGKIRNWPAARGAGLAIHGFGLPPDAPLMRIYQRWLEGNRTRSPSPRPSPVKGEGDRAGAPVEGEGERLPSPRPSPGKTPLEGEGERLPSPLAGEGLGVRGRLPLAIRAEHDTAHVVLAVARDPAAIGLVDLSQLPPDDKSVKWVSIDLLDGTTFKPAPTDPAGKSLGPVIPDSYPLAEACTLYVSPTAGPTARRFAQWLASGPCPDILLAQHLVPAAPDSAERADAEVAGSLTAVKAGAAGPLPGAIPNTAPADESPAGDSVVNDSPAIPSNEVAMSRVAPGPAERRVSSTADLPASNSRTKPSLQNTSQPSTAVQSGSDVPASTILWLLTAAGGVSVAVIVAAIVAAGRNRRRRSAAQARQSAWDDEIVKSLQQTAPNGRPTSHPCDKALVTAVPLTEKEQAMIAARAAFDPYHKWLGIPACECADGGPDHYRLLGVTAFESDPEVIAEAADRQMAHLRTFQLGKYAVLAEQLLSEVAAAKVQLMKPAKKSLYDQHLRRQLAETTRPR
jgi:ABC-type phosphate transport system substrate-binding protein